MILLLLLLLLSVVLLTLPAGEQQPPRQLQLRISEVCSKNDSVIANNAGRFPDYVELYNEGEDISLSGFRFGDGRSESTPLGEIVLHKGEYRVFFLGDDMGLTLPASGSDCLQLLSKEGTVVAQLSLPPMTADQALIWQGDVYLVSNSPSPGFPNNEQGVALFQTGFPRQDPALIFSELLIGNVCAMPGIDGRFSDYVELRNVSDSSVALSGYWLSDDPGSRFACRLPELTLAPGEMLLVCCDGGSGTDEAGVFHAGFSLSEGETLYLTDREGGNLTLAASYLGDDISLALTQDGTYQPQPPSLGYPNDEQGQLSFALSRIDPHSPLVISEVLLSACEVPYLGTMQDVVELTNRSDAPVSTDGWFFSDGGDPYACPLPAQTLLPGESLTLICSRSTTGFSLAEGETVYLLSPELLYAFPAVCAARFGQSLHLTGETEGAFAFDEPSPGFAAGESWLEASLPATLRISEVMSANGSYLKGPYGEVYDYIELYNGGDEPVALEDFCLSDDPDELSGRPLPAGILNPGEYRVFLLTKSTINLPAGYDAVPLTLSSQGEGLYLSKNERIVDWVHLPALAQDCAWGRAGASARFSMLLTPSPGAPNGEGAQRCAIPTAGTPQGVYEGVEYVDVILEGEGSLYYTTDATVPGPNATLYTAPIRLTESAVLRVVSRRDGCIDSEPLDLTYIINEGDHLPAVAIVSDPDGLWSDERGIYAMGPNAHSFYPYFGANFHQDWEREASIAMFELDGTGFAAPCGIKIHGAYSRGEAKKSLAVHFRDRYGLSRLDYPIFGEEGLDSYESFLLRNSGQDMDMGKMRNVLITSIAADYTRLAVQKYRPVVVYINGEYFGIHYIRDKVNEQFAAGYCNANVEDVLLCEGNGSSCEEYRELVRYAATHSMRNADNFAYMESQMDMQVYMDYIITQIIIANTDNSNVKFFKTPDTKWHWVLYDTDLSMFQYAFDSVADHLNPLGTGGYGSTDTSTTLINRLLQNEGFRDEFLRRFGWHMSTVWTEENINARIDEIIAQIGPDMQKDCDRWGLTYSSWEAHIKTIRNFAHRRERALLQYVRAYFDLSTAALREYGFPV